jgi:hypothetical protein
LRSERHGWLVLSNTQLRFERVNLPFRDLEAPARANCQEKSDGPENYNSGACQRQKYPKIIIHRLIPAKSNALRIARL